MRLAIAVLTLLLSFSSLSVARSGGHSSYRSYSHSSRTSTYHVRSSRTRSHHYAYTSHHSTARTSYPRYHAPRATATRSYAPRDSHGRIRRSAAAKNAFKRQHPCPATGRSTGPCPGYVIDHVNPLVCGGTDAPSNMQWQTTAAAKAKDKVERRCR